MRLALAAAALVLSFAGEAAAQTQPFESRGPAVQGWAVDLGVGALHGVDSDGDTGGETRVVPYVAASWNDVVYFSPFEGLGWNALKSDSFRAGVQLRPRFDADEVEGLVLDRPDFGADAAVYAYGRIPGNVVIGGRISRDVSGVSDGTEIVLQAAYQTVTPIGGLTLTGFARGGDRKLAEAYYGVDAGEALANGISTWSPDGGLQGAGINAVLVAPLSGGWALGGLAGWERRLGDVADSPLSRNDDAWRVGAFLARRFTF
ncbi:MAG: MipA/OmpV family protein [Caulobacteraceae bacterium]|nr:MipA/OmpV family protein [Caulobacteraceae bacterium]